MDPLVAVMMIAAYLLVIAGSLGLVLYDRWFGSVDHHWERPFVPQRLGGLDARQVWDGSWGAIILGTLGQLVGYWLDRLCR